MTIFWDEVKKLKEEETAIRTASLGHLNIFRKTVRYRGGTSIKYLAVLAYSHTCFCEQLTQYAYSQEVINEGVKLQTPQKRVNGVNETEKLSSKKLNIII